jgi:hypothetical protein
MKINQMRYKVLLPILILIFVVLLFFSPVFLKGYVVFPDLLNYYEPWNDYTQDLTFRFSHLKSDFVDALVPKLNLVKSDLKNGEIPLWSDVIDLGKPLIQTSLEYILMPIYIFVWILPIDIGFTLAIIFKALIGALGMYFLLVDLNVRRWIAVAVGIVYVFSGFNLSWFLGNASIVGQLAPWSFFLLNKVYSATTIKSVWKYLVGLTFVYFFQIISGFVAGAGYIIYFSAFYVLGLFVIDVFKSTKFSSEIKWYDGIRTGMLVLVSIIVAVGLACIKLLPNLEWINFINVGYRNAYSTSSLSLSNLYQLLFPNYNGNPVFFNWFLGSNWNETSSYVTIILLLVSPIGVFEAIKERNKKVLLLGILAGLSFMIVWNIGPFLKIISKLPVFNSSSSTRLLLVFDLFVCILGAFGLESILSRKLKLLPILLSALGFLFVLGVVFNSIINLDRLNFTSINLYDPKIFRIISTLPALFILFVFGHFVYLWNKKRVSEKFFTIVISILLVVDIFHFTFRQIPMVPKEYFFPETQITKFLEENQGEGRSLVFDGMFMISGSQLFYRINSVVTHNLHRPEERELVSKVSENAWATKTAPMMSAKKTDFDSPILDFYGVKYLVVTEKTNISNDTWKLVLDVPSEGRIYENLDYVEEKYWFTSNIERLISADQFFLSIEDVAKLSKVYIKNDITNGNNYSESQVDLEIIKDTNDLNILKICTNEPGILTTRESFWPGWTATVNGVERTVLEVNYIYRGIPIEKGCSEVIERYQPRAFGIGRIISLSSIFLIILSGISVIVWDNRKKEIIKRRMS